MSKSNGIFGALPIVANHYGQRLGVKVRVVAGQSTGSTNGKEILLPNVDRPEIWGLLVHEAAHVRYTDFDAPHDFKGLQFSLLNTVEDIRIEAALMQEYPGTRIDFQILNDCFIKDGKYEMVPVSDEVHPAAVIQALVMYWGYQQVCRYNGLEAHTESAQAALVKHFGDGVVTRMLVLLRKIARLTSTEDAINLTKDIIRMLEEEAEKDQKSQPQPQQSNDDQADPSQDQSSPGQESHSGGQDQPQSGSQGQPDQVGPDQTQASAGQADSQQSSSGKPTSGAVAQAIEQALAATESDLPKDKHEALRQELCQASSHDAYTNLNYDIGEPCLGRQSSDPSNGIEMVNQVQAVSQVLQQQLLRAVQAHRQTRRAVVTHGKRISGRHVHRVLSGDMRIFVEKHKPKIDANTAVHVLIDISGSMYGGDDLLAKQAGLAIALALERIKGVNPGVSFFKDNQVLSACPHNQSPRLNAGRFVAAVSDGGTPMAQAIWQAAYELSSARANRHIIIVVTDGGPSNGGAVHDVVARCDASDIEMVGVGINSSAIQNYIRESIVIRSVQDLLGTLFAVMKDKLASIAA